MGDPLVNGVATSVQNERTKDRTEEDATVPETETKSVRKKRARAHQQSKESAMAIAKSFQLQIKNHRNDISFLFNKIPKGRRKKRTPQVDGIERRKKEQQRGGTKEDKSLRGTTTGTCDTSDQETSIETNLSLRMIDLQGWQRGKIVYNTAGHHKKKRQATTKERRERRIKNRTKIITQPRRKQQRE